MGGFFSILELINDLKKIDRPHLLRLKNLVTAGVVSADVLRVYEALQSDPDAYEGRVVGPLFLYVRWLKV